MNRAVVSYDDELTIVQGRHVGRVLAEAGMKSTYVGTLRGWTLDLRHLADVIAVLERASYRVRVASVPRPTGGTR
ncbi:MAG: hypothetical protein JWR35_615 [Marmoricola sp.]|nr:hypothetical protein [Marmoricola sp.]